VKGDGSGTSENALDIGVAAASCCDIGARPRISSIVRSIDVVEYIVESTAPRRVYGDATSATVRCASTWSDRSAVVLDHEDAVSFQNFDFESASTSRPSATSFSAPSRERLRSLLRADRVVVPRRMIISRGISPFFSYSRNSLSQRSTRVLSRMSRSNPGRTGR